MKKNTYCKTSEDSSLNEVPITENEYNDILNIQADILAMIASRDDYGDILEHLCKLAEKSLPNSVASIMLVDKETGLMNVLSAPSIPKSGLNALANLKPGIGSGSCGNALFHNEAQYVRDTFNDSRWSDIRQIAIDFNLCACWSVPICDEQNNPIGSFALSSFEHRSPSLFHKKLLQTATSIVNIVLKNKTIEKRIKLLARTELKKTQEQIEKMAYKDSLTGLCNKTQLEQLLTTDEQKNLLLLNVNNFSYINTAYGFEVGDKLLIELSSILKENFKTFSTCRINSDEFALLFKDDINIEHKTLDIQEYFHNKEIMIDNITLNISFTYGAACGVKNLLRNSALALKQAKESGKNNLYIFNQDADSINHSQRESFIASNNILHSALNENRVIPFFQGIRNNKTKEITKYEVLARIQLGSEIISPYIFLEPARLSGLLPDITKTIIDKSFSYMANNNYTFSINITEEDLSKNYLFEYLNEKELEYGISSSRVILEILEGVSATGKKSHVKQLTQLKDSGYSIAIDDFGSEYSNFERVLDLDIDFLKIDARYIKDIYKNPKSYEVTRAIVFFAKNAKIPCIAEFVHNTKVQSIVEELGIDYSQGFLFSEPSKKLID